MKYFTAIVMIGLWGNSFSQIKITPAHMPVPGDTVRYSEALPSQLPDLLKTGADQTWDFTGFTHIRQGVHEYKFSYQTPYILDFGFTATGLKIADSVGQAPLLLTNVYDFYKTSTSKYENIGTGFTPDVLKVPQKGKHSDPDEVYLFPLEFGDTFTSSFALRAALEVFSFPMGEFFRTGNRFTEVDGWGKISTPYGSDIDCIRVKAVIDSRDSIAVSNPQINFGTDTRMVVYKWLSTSEKIPLVEISGTEVAGNFVPQYIRYRDTYRGGSVSVNRPDASQVTVYPNPASQTLVIHNPQAAVQPFRLVNYHGQTLLSGHVEASGSHSILVENIPDGLYFIIFESEKWSSAKKVIIRH